MQKTALVTGGTRGIGAEISRALKAANHNVVAIYHGNDNAAADFNKATGIPVYKWDVGDFEACQTGVAQVIADHGQIDILVNNAGITRDSMLHKMDYADWADVIHTNLTSCFNMCRQVLGPMREKGFGRIINISSVNGQKGQFGQTNYSAAKAGILGFTKSLAQESAAKGITVNAIAPGYVHTDMVAKMPAEILTKIVAQIPVGRLGEPEEIARAAVFLASDEAGYITGSTLSINGGLYYV